MFGRSFSARLSHVRATPGNLQTHTYPNAADCPGRVDRDRRHDRQGLYARGTAGDFRSAANSILCSLLRFVADQSSTRAPGRTQRRRPAGNRPSCSEAQCGGDRDRCALGRRRALCHAQRPEQSDSDAGMAGSAIARCLEIHGGCARAEARPQIDQSTGAGVAGAIHRGASGRSTNHDRLIGPRCARISGRRTARHDRAFFPDDRTGYRHAARKRWPAGRDRWHLCPGVEPDPGAHRAAQRRRLSDRRLDRERCRATGGADGAWGRIDHDRQPGLLRYGGRRT